MKKIILVFVIVACALSACHKKAIPTITTRKTDPPPPISGTVDIKPDIGAGKTIFTARCSRCHDLPAPAKYTVQRWEVILKLMLPKARLSEEQEIHVTAYIKKNSAK